MIYHLLIDMNNLYFFKHLEINQIIKVINNDQILLLNNYYE